MAQLPIVTSPGRSFASLSYDTRDRVLEEIKATFRWLCLIALIAFPVYGGVLFVFLPKLQDPWLLRAFLTMGILFAYLGSFWTNRIKLHIEWSSFVLVVLLGLHSSYLLLLNQLDPVLVMGQMGLFAGAIALFSLLHTSRRFLLAFVLCMAFGAVSVFFIRDPQLPPLPVFFSFLGVLLIAYLSLRSHLHTLLQLRDSEERYALAVRGTYDGLWDWDLKTNLIFFSIRWKQMLGYYDGDIANQPKDWFALVHQEDVERFQEKIKEHTAGKSHLLECELRMLHKDGRYRWMLCRGSAISDSAGRVFRMAGSLMDITSRKKFLQKLRQDTMHDILTGLPNRALFLDRLEHTLTRAQRHESHFFAVLLLDIHQFKQVNQRFGPTQGDDLLREIAQRLTLCLRAGDTLARMADDEYAILLEDLQDVGDATRVVQRIQDAFANSFEIEEETLTLDAHVGISLSSSEVQHPEDFLRDAAVALSRAKAQHGVFYQIFDTTLRLEGSQTSQENPLALAIQNGEMCNHYQPIISLKDGTIVGFEALVRWQHPARGLLFPRDFISLAQELELLAEIGWDVLHEACRQMLIWQTRFPALSDFCISVNFCFEQVHDPEGARKIRHILDDTRLQADALMLELSESLVPEQNDQTIDQLFSFKKLGLRLALDDFGAGDASFHFLHRWPLDILKIDPTFTKNLSNDPTHLEIVRSIRALARNAGIQVTAEGIEDDLQLEEIRKLKCEYAQGFLFSPALDAQQATALLERNPSW